MSGVVRKQGFVVFALWVLVVTQAGADDDRSGDIELPPSISWERHLQLISDSGTSVTRYQDGLVVALRAGLLDEAEIQAKFLVETTAGPGGGTGLRRSRALQNLALVQHLDGNYPAAIMNYQAAVGAIEGDIDRLSNELDAPLHALGIAHADAGRPVDAMRVFGRALHVSNVNQGPHSLEQEPLLWSILALHESQDDVASAKDSLDRIYQLHVRTSSPDSEALLPVLNERAAFFARHGMLLQEYYAWDEIIYLLRRNRGADHISLVEPYLSVSRNLIQNLGRVEYRSGPTAPSAEKFLKRAVSIVDKNEDVGPRLRARAMLSTGDYYMLVGTYATGHRYYADVWALMTQSNLDDARAIELEKVNPISRPPPDPYANFEYRADIDNITDRDYLPGVMVVQFTVNVRGKVQDVTLVEAQPPGFSRMERRLRSALKDFVYRPRLVDGKAVATPGVRYRLEYHYLTAEYEASLEKDGKLNRPVPPRS